MILDIKTGISKLYLAVLETLVKSVSKNNMAYIGKYIPVKIFHRDLGTELLCRVCFKTSGVPAYIVTQPCRIFDDHLTELERD